MVRSSGAVMQKRIPWWNFCPHALAPPIVSPATKLACFARSDKVSGETLCSRIQKIPKGLLILHDRP